MNREHLIPGIVAIILAVLFPLYWFSGFVTVGMTSLLDAYIADVTSFTPMDGLFILIGLMEVYLYLSLRKNLQQQLQGGFAASLALLMAIAVGVFTALVLFDVSFAISAGLDGSVGCTALTLAAVVSIGLSIVVGLVGLTLSIALLMARDADTVLLKIFAVFLLICSLLTITVFLAPLVPVLYPVALIVLAVYFLRGGGDVEVV